MNPIKAFLNYHYTESFNAVNCLTVLKLLSTNKLINNEILAFIPEVFNKIIESHFETREIYKDIEKDEVLTFIKEYKFTHIPLDQFAISKYLVLYFDNDKLLDYIFSLPNKKSLLEHLSNNITAYYHFYGNVPKAFNQLDIRKQYQKVRDIIKDNDTELEFFLTCFKYNKMTEYTADILNIWRSKNLEALNFNLTDFVLSSKLKAGNQYHKEVMKVFNNDGQDRNGSKLVLSTLAYLKDGNDTYAVNNFLEAFEKRIRMLRDNDGQLLNLLIHTDGQTRGDPEREMRFTLARVNLSDKIRKDLRVLFTNIRQQSTNAFQANEKIAHYIMNGFTSNTKGSYTDDLLNNIRSNLNELKNVRYEDFADEVVTDSLENILDKLKVLLFLDKRRFKILFFLLEKEFQVGDELKKIELDYQDRDNILKKIKAEKGKYSGDDIKFLDLLIQFVELKAEDVKKVVIDENTMRGLNDSILEGFNINDLIVRANEYTQRAKDKYYKVSRHDKMLESLKYLESIGIDLLKKDTQNKEEKLALYKSYLEKYKGLLKIIGKRKIPQFKLFRGLNTTAFPNHFNNKMKNYIFNHISYRNQLVSFVLKRLYSQVLFYPHRLKGDKAKIRSLILGARSRYEAEIVNYIKSHLNLKQINHENVFSKVLDKIQAIEADLVNKKDEEVFIENLFKQICATQGIQLDPVIKTKTPDHLANLKNLLGQDYVVLDYKCAIYMILFGVENNLALGNYET
jgi:hypothetical protein